MSDVRLKGLRALVVDDSKPLQIITKRLLEIAGAAQVDVADCGDDAATLASRNVYDLFLLDIQMPSQDGHAVLKRLRAAGATAPAVAMTADPTPTERRRCIDSGFALCISKPFSRDDLAAAALQVVSGVERARNYPEGRRPEGSRR